MMNHRFRFTASILCGLLILGCTDSGESGYPLQSLRLRNLYDAFGSTENGTQFDFGFSVLVEYGGTTILFDSGTDADILKNNVKAFGIDLADVDIAVGSHSHADHISGFDYLLEVNPEVKIYLPKEFYGFGAPMNFNVSGMEPEKSADLPQNLQYFNGEQNIAYLKPSGRFWKANVEYVDQSFSISEDLALIVTRSPYLGYFSRYPGFNFKGEPSETDINYMGLIEISLVVKTDRGQSLIVGCSHSTVDGIVSEARQFTEDNIDLVMGGYHLLPYGSEDLEALASRLKNELQVKSVAPSHCTGPLAQKILRDVFGEDYLPAGLGSDIVL